MFPLDLDPARPRRVIIGGAPEGHDARILAELAARRPAGLLHVALDDARAARLAEAVAFFAPAVETVFLPAWDCLPSDRVSPNPEIVALRVEALTRLLEPRPAGRPLLVLTTVNAVLQRLPPREVLAGASYAVKPGQRVDLEAMQAFLARNGYRRAQTVREPGEFAVRGGIVDLFPPGTAEPLRLDLFGDELEGVRAFDPLSQRTTGTRDAVVLRPMSELFLDRESIARFRSGYREQFGAVTGGDALYEAVTAGRKHDGMEHWLPLFHERMATLFEWLPDVPVTLDHQAGSARDSRLAQIADFYEARRSFHEAPKRGGGTSPVYHPLPPGLLYLDAAEWDGVLAARAVAELSPFGVAPGAADSLDAFGRRGRDFAEIRTNPDLNLFEAVRQHLLDLRSAGRRTMVAGTTAGARDRLCHLLHEHAVPEAEIAADWAAAERLDPRRVAVVVLPIDTGFAAPDLAVITEQDILGDRLTRPQKKRRRAEAFIAEASQLNSGDLVVHSEYGIGRYDGLETLTVSGAPHDCLKVIYADNQRLFVPVENIEVLSRFGAEDATVALDKLGGAGWQARKARVKKRLKDMAEALLRIAAARELKHAEAFAAQPAEFEEFCARFPYAETDDQLRAIDDVLADLGGTRPMDRLVCGDVGFGKTEVALRAAFVAALAGAQVAVVAPTTLLARQHYRTFTQRFAGLPVRIGQISRLVSAKESKAVKDGLADGTLDIVIGTHALLSPSIRFRNLALLVVDEEQHFGVKQKERLKELRAAVHVLTLTATPIPRTLQLSLSGVRELSLIATPPVDRLAVRTFVLPYDPVIVREAIQREHFRGGQTYYVCPRIEDLEPVGTQLRELVPEVKIVTAHGRLGSTQIEEVMSAFYDGRFDVLLSTSIVESGLDVPAANTLIVHRADQFGLAQLYQLRGRIGRSKRRGYAYLTHANDKPLTETARQRLHVIETLDTLGAGFTLASHDMDIRGAGNLLGEEQSGHIREVGIELYQQMLQDAVAAARAGAQAGEAEAEEQWSPQINLGMPVLIPDGYVADLHVRLELYRRIARLEDRAEIDAFAAELVDRFGALPEEVGNLLALIALKRLCKAAGVERLDAGPKGAVVAFRNNTFARPEKLIRYIAGQAGTIKIRPDQRLVLMRAWDGPKARMDGARQLMERLAQLAA